MGKLSSRWWSIALGMCIFIGGCEQVPVMDPAAGGAGSQIPGAQVLTLIETSAPSYEPGALVRIQLTNRTQRLFNYNLCRASLEWANTEGDWRVVAPTLSPTCTPEYRGLEPSRWAQYSFRFEAPQRRGSYRVRALLQDPLSGQYLYALSNEFTVRRDE
jgi:hypothetical protein